jgi:hypothetical protein
LLAACSFGGYLFGLRNPKDEGGMFSKPQAKFYYTTNITSQNTVLFMITTLISQMDEKFLNWDTENGNDSKGLTIKYEAERRANENIYLLPYHVINVQTF